MTLRSLITLRADTPTMTDNFDDLPVTKLNVKSSSELVSHTVVFHISVIIAEPPQEHATEPMLRPNPRRFVILPIVYPEIWAMYKKAEGESVDVTASCCFS